MFEVEAMQVINLQQKGASFQSIEPTTRRVSSHSDDNTAKALCENSDAAYNLPNNMQGIEQQDPFWLSSYDVATILCICIC